MFRKVTNSMFKLAKYYENYWKTRSSNWCAKYHREAFSKKPIPVQINIFDMEKSFGIEYLNIKNNLSSYLPIDLLNELNNIIINKDDFNSELWVKIVYHFAAAFKNINDEDEIARFKLLDTLKTLWIGRFVSYAKHVDKLDINEAEKIIQNQAETFEKQFEYFKSIY
jgi:hypothetical protein